jgi:hypothetical protein
MSERFESKRDVEGEEKQKRLCGGLKHAYWTAQ